MDYNNNILKGFSNVDEIQKGSLEPFDFDESTIIKGKKVPIGTISNGYKKVGENKWQKVSKHGLTKKEHNEKAAKHRELTKNENRDKPNYKMTAEQQKHDRESFKHGQASMKLSDKEYSDTDVEGSNGASGEDTFMTNKNRERNPNDNSKENAEIAKKNLLRELKKIEEEEAEAAKNDGFYT